MFEFPATVRIILEKMSTDKFSCYLVGGSVRDILLSHQPTDYDFVTDRRPEKIIEAAEQAGWKVWRQGAAFGVINVLVGGKQHEITTMRTETYGADPHRPIAVKFLGDITADLARRDFTINAMAMDRWGNIIDPFDGQGDLSRGVIRCVGVPRDRFREDPLRVLRAARFLAKIGFVADPGVTTAAGDTEVRRRFTELSVERVRDELERILLAPLPSRGLHFLMDTGALELACRIKKNRSTEPVPFLPEVAALKGVKQNPRFHAYDVWEHTLKTVDGIAAEPVLRWAALLHDVAKGRGGIRCLNKRGEIADYGHAGAGAELSQGILKRLRVSGETARLVVWLVRNHMVLPDVDDKRMGRWIKKSSHFFAGREEFIIAVQQLFQLADADNTARGRGRNPAYIEAVTGSFQRVLSHTVLYPEELAINGSEIAGKVGEGPLVGKILRDLLVDVQTGRLANREEVLLVALNKKAKRYARKGRENESR